MDQLTHIDGVIGVGQRLGIDTLLVTEDISNENKQLIETILESDGRREVDIYRITGFVRLNGTCGVGTKIGGKDSIYGTVGGLVSRFFNAEKQVCALTCGHVAVHVLNSGIMHLSDISIPLLSDSVLFCERNEENIAAIVLGETVQSKLTLSGEFNTAYGKRKQCDLFSYKQINDKQPVDLLSGVVVYLRGASTSLGFGRITSSFYMIKLSQVMICFEDVEPGQPFCQPGDSGAIICRDVGDKTEAIAMLYGEALVQDNAESRKIYFGFELESGLEALSRKHGQFTLMQDRV